MELISGEQKKKTNKNRWNIRANGKIPHKTNFLTYIGTSCMVSVRVVYMCTPSFGLNPAGYSDSYLMFWTKLLNVFAACFASQF